MKNIKFSERIGISNSIKETQIEYIDDELRNGLWNMCSVYFLDKFETIYLPEYETIKFSKDLWHDYFKLPIDEIPNSNFDIKSKIKRYFFDCYWFQVYDFLEYLIQSKYIFNTKEKLINGINKVLEREFSGYRLIEKQFSPITNEIELEETKKAISNTKAYTPFEGANIHFTKALEFLSDRQNPNYRNSIKESISAVESTVRIITQQSTLGKGLKKIEESGLEINQMLKQGFEKIYAYTNDKENGIRHAIVEQPNEPDFEDAKYMIVSCSSFVNFLISKSSKIGIL